MKKIVRNGEITNTEVLIVDNGIIITQNLILRDASKHLLWTTAFKLQELQHFIAEILKADGQKA